MTADSSDEALMLAFRAGSAAAFDALYARHRGPVFRYLRRQAPQVAEELFQDVWMRIVQARSSYEVQAKFATWLYTIAHHRLVDYYRAGARGELASYDAIPELLDAHPAPLPSPDWQIERKELAARLLAALETLPAAQREAFLLQQEGELSVEDIAQITGVNRETAKSRLRYALAKLRSNLADLQ